MIPHGLVGPERNRKVPNTRRSGGDQYGVRSGSNEREITRLKRSSSAVVVVEQCQFILKKET